MAAAFRRADSGEGWVVTEKTIKTVASLISLIVIVGGFAISWGASQAHLAEAVSHKEYDVDMVRMREDKQAAINALDQRIVLDSLRDILQQHRIEHADSVLNKLTNRLTNFICDQGSRRSYCQ